MTEKLIFTFSDLTGKTLPRYNLHILLILIATFCVASSNFAQAQSQDLYQQIQNAIDKHYSGSFKDSQKIITETLNQWPNELEKSDRSILKALTFSNEIALVACGKSEEILNSIQVEDLDTVISEFWLDTIILQSDCLIENEQIDEAHEFLHASDKILTNHLQNEPEIQIMLIRQLGYIKQIATGNLEKAKFNFKRSKDFDFSTPVKAELLETAINAFLDANEPELALEVALSFLNGVEKADDFWFRDHVYSKILLGRVYASLERFKESELMASQAYISYLTLKSDADIKYDEPIPYSDWLSPEDAYILNHLALLLDQQGRYSEAAAAYQIAISIFEEDKSDFEDQSFILVLLSNFAHVLSVIHGQEENSRIFLSKAVENNSTLIDQYPVEQANLFNTLAILYANSGQIEEAKSYFLRGIDVLEKVDEITNSALNIKAQLYNNAATLPIDFVEAEFFYLKSIEALKELDDDESALVQTYSNLGVLYLEQRQLTEAGVILRTLFESERLVEELFVAINFLNAFLDTDFSTSGLSQEQLQFLIDLNLEFHQHQIRNLSAGDLFVWLPEIQDSLFLSSRTFEGVIKYCEKFICDEDDLFATLFELVQISEFTIISLAAQIEKKIKKEEKTVFAEYIASLFHHSEVTQKLFSELNLAERMLDLQSNNEIANHEIFSERLNFELLDFEKLSLQPKTAILKFFDTGKNLYRFDITSEGHSIVKLVNNTDELKQELNFLKSSLKNEKTLNLDAQLDSLGLVFLKDLSFELRDINTLYFSPVKYMKFLPPSILRYEDRYLIEQSSIVTLPAFSKAFLETKPKTKKFEFAFLGFGAPKFQGEKNKDNSLDFNETVLRGMAKSKEVIDAYPPLPFAFSELNESRAILEEIGPTKILSGKSASRKAVLKEINKHSSRLISFATHNVPANENSLEYFPGLLFSSDNTISYNGLLTTRDILTANVDAEVIYLSSCNSASGNTQRTGEWEGFINSFIYAGARSVIASSWRVEDEAASILHKNFSKHLANGLSANTALNAAINHLRTKSDFTHPLYWGAFSFYSGVYQ